MISTMHRLDNYDKISITCQQKPHPTPKKLTYTLKLMLSQHEMYGIRKEAVKSL